jgi:Flp pilus assembly protein TadG
MQGDLKQLGRRRGTAIIEASLMMPWLAFLFVGILDFGFYSYSAISIQNAARAAAMRSAASQYSLSTSNSCVAALGELRGLPNMVGVTTCAATAGAVSDAIPAAVEIVPLDNTTTPPCADCGVKATATSVQARVTYRTLPMIPIPGFLTGRLTMTRTAESRVLVQ